MKGKKTKNNSSEVKNVMPSKIIKVVKIAFPIVFLLQAVSQVGNTISSLEMYYILLMIVATACVFIRKTISWYVIAAAIILSLFFTIYQVIHSGAIFPTVSILNTLFFGLVLLFFLYVARQHYHITWSIGQISDVISWIHERQIPADQIPSKGRWTKIYIITICIGLYGCSLICFHNVNLYLQKYYLRNSLSQGRGLVIQEIETGSPFTEILKSGDILLFNDNSALYNEESFDEFLVKNLNKEITHIYLIRDHASHREPVHISNEYLDHGLILQANYLNRLSPTQIDQLWLVIVYNFILGTTALVACLSVYLVLVHIQAFIRVAQRSLYMLLILIVLHAVYASYLTYLTMPLNIELLGWRILISIALTFGTYLVIMLPYIVIVLSGLFFIHKQSILLQSNQIAET